MSRQSRGEARPERAAGGVDLTEAGVALARRLVGADKGRVRETLDTLPRRQKGRLVRALQVIREIEARDEATNLLGRLRGR